MARPTLFSVFAVLSGLLLNVADASTTHAADVEPLRPSGVLTFRRDPALGLGSGHAWPVIQDAAGGVWAWSRVNDDEVAASRLFHWTGAAWEKTPVAMPRHPHWS